MTFDIILMTRIEIHSFNRKVLKRAKRYDNETNKRTLISRITTLLLVMMASLLSLVNETITSSRRDVDVIFSSRNKARYLS